MHRTAAHRADLGEAQHRPRQASPHSIRRKSVPPADLATRRRERPPRHPRTRPRPYCRRRTPRHTREPGERASGGEEIPVKKPFQAVAPVRRGAADGRQIDPLTDGQREGHPWGIRLLHASSHNGHNGLRSRPEMVGHHGPRRARKGGHGAAHDGPRCVPPRLCGQGVEGRLDRGHGPRFRDAPRPKLPTHRQLYISRPRTPAARAEVRGSDAHHSDGGHAGVALSRPGAAPGGPGGDLLRPRDPGLQRRPTGGPWANVCGGCRRQIRRAVSLRAAVGQPGRPAQGQESQAL